MSTFVEECRQEWRRLGVPDVLAEEMAQDLAADLAEAESEGVAAADILGESDPRRFAATWARERGLVAENARNPRRGVPRLVSAACLLILVAAAIAVPLALTSTGDSAKPALHARLFAWGRDSISTTRSIDCEVFRNKHNFTDPLGPVRTLKSGGWLFCEINSKLGPNGPVGRWVWALDATGEAYAGPSRVIPAPVLPEPAGARFSTLPIGREWSLGPFTCERGTVEVTCRNGSQHGFTLSNKSQKTF